MAKKMKIIIATRSRCYHPHHRCRHFFAYRNMNHDYSSNEKFLEKNGTQAGLSGRDGSIKTMGQRFIIWKGPNNGPKLLLLHGQQVSCYDYAKVFAGLSKEFMFMPLITMVMEKSSKKSRQV
ncbi:MAG: hypothetical protein ACOX6Y_02445 [Christensenellales bacterium]